MNYPPETDPRYGGVGVAIEAGRQQLGGKLVAASILGNLRENFLDTANELEGNLVRLDQLCSRLNIPTLPEQSNANTGATPAAADGTLDHLYAVERRLRDDVKVLAQFVSRLEQL